uniref:Mor transcription activator domain-containing protein n=1 Tax=Hydrogenovibrio crunogenus (strain DSM 25203 / XCL-2) TaxID=317025 RepID=Q31HV4_HYDCU
MPETAYVEDDLSVVERVNQAVGFNATNELCARFGGRTFYVPANPSDKHIITILLGKQKAMRLGELIGGQSIELPALREVRKIKEEDRICRLYAIGATDREIFDTFDISKSQLDRLKKRNKSLIEAYIIIIDKNCGLFSSLKGGK